MPKLPSVIISYSHKDSAWKERLLPHLGALQKDGQLRLWHDREIQAGEDWLETIVSALEEASAAVLLISADFLSSEFICREEIPRILERRARGYLRVFPIIVKPCPWKSVSWLSRLQVLPEGGVPLSSMAEQEIDRQLAEISEQVARALAAPVATDAVPDRGRSPVEDWQPTHSPPGKPVPVGERPAGGRYRLVAFDLDGTLIRGLDFSWQEVWRYLGFPDELRKEGMRRYLAGTISYPEWCEWCLEHFRGAGLRKSHFKEIARGLAPTRNLRPALDILRREGLVTAIVSGGIDTLLFEVIPEAEALFDYIFINRLVFDEAGLLTAILPTPFDYQGKPAAIDRICAERGFESSEAVFVGEGLNDAHVVGRVGLLVAYPPKDQRVEQTAHVSLREDDLLQIVPLVIAS